jgi:flagellar basal-body rod protein FlgF
MQSASLVLLSDQQALSRVMDVIANNVANVNTSGFKREGVAFASYLTQSAPGQTLSFVADGATYRDTRTGSIDSTGNPLDLAIQGKGYFEVQTPDGIRYTRGGSFQLDNQGQITDHNGNPVLNDGGQPITLPDTVTDINISSDGFVSARVDNNPALAQLGKIAVVQFDNELALQPEGGGLLATDQPPAPAAEGSIVQGALEQSNVAPVNEMTQMITIQRAYESACNLISQENQRLDDALAKLSKTTA